MIKLCIVPTVRPELMFRFMDALQRCEQLRDWGVVAITQEWSNADAGRLMTYPALHGRIAEGRKQPVYPLRQEAMRYYPADVYVNCDDDMIPLPGLTHWDVMAGKLMREQDIGVISGNWARSHAMLKHRTPVDEYVFQPITNMAGGQMYRKDVADWLYSNSLLPVAPYMFDDICASLGAYLGGWKNARYRGSVLIHNILSPGGLKVQFNEDRTLTHPAPSLLTVRPAKVVYDAPNNWYMPVISDVRQEAHVIHKRNREERFGALPT